MKQHTPGPWFIRKFDDGKGKHPDGSHRPRVCYRVGVPIVNENWAKELAPTAKPICLLPECSNDDAANVILIAAAPEMLAALEAVATLAVPSQVKDAMIWSQVGLAIAKAKGKTK